MTITVNLNQVGLRVVLLSKRLVEIVGTITATLMSVTMATQYLEMDVHRLALWNLVMSAPVVTLQTRILV